MGALRQRADGQWRSDAPDRYEAGAQEDPDLGRSGHGPGGHEVDIMLTHESAHQLSIFASRCPVIDHEKIAEAEFPEALPRGASEDQKCTRGAVERARRAVGEA